MFCNPKFSLDSQNQGNTVEKVNEAPRTEATPVVQASTSLASPGITLPQEEKLKLAHKLLIVSSRIMRVLLSFLDQIVGTDLFVFILLAGSVRTGEQPAPGRF